MLPLFVGSLHALSDHKHDICFSKSESHFHQKDLDCTLHLLKNTNSLLIENSFSLQKEYTKIILKERKKNFLKSHQHLSFSLRAPPVYIY